MAQSQHSPPPWRRRVNPGRQPCAGVHQQPFPWWQEMTLLVAAGSLTLLVAMEQEDSLLVEVTLFSPYESEGNCV